MINDDFARLAFVLHGLCIMGCWPGSPSQRAGLRYGDILLEVNGVRTPDWDTYISVTRERRPLTSVRVFRAGVEVELGYEPAATVRPFDPMGLVGAVVRSGPMYVPDADEGEDLDA